MTYARKGRERGEARWSARLTEADVLDIRARYGRGECLKALHVLYPQCSKPNLHHIVHGRRWKYLLDAPALDDAAMTQSDTIGEGAFARASMQADQLGMLTELNRVKALFQLRAVMAAMGLPNPPGPHSGASGVGQGDAS